MSQYCTVCGCFAPCGCYVPTITTNTTEVGTWSSNNIILADPTTYSGNYQMSFGDYVFYTEDEKLIIRDSKGNECVSFQDGVMKIGEKTIHQVVLDIIEMYNGTKPLVDLLTDPDKGKRELGKEIHERRSKKPSKEDS